MRQFGENGGAVVFHGDVHRPEDPVGNIAGTRYEQKITAGHEFSPGPFGLAHLGTISSAIGFRYIRYLVYYIQ